MNSDRVTRSVTSPQNTDRLYEDFRELLPAAALGDILQPSLQKPKVRYRDLSVSDPGMRRQLLEAIDTLLISGQLLMGPAVEKWERMIADYCGAPHCVGVSSGTDAIFLALKVCGVVPGDEVIVPAMSWVATVNAVVAAGALPVFVDIQNDLNIDVDLIEKAISSRTRAILPVHYTGRLCDMAAINRIAAKHGLAVVEDAAQAFGARDETGRAGGLGDAAAFSLNPMKVFPGYGEVGAVLVKDGKANERLKALRYLGTVNKEVCIEASLNYKIDTIQAAMMLVSFNWVEPALKRRIEIAARYGNGLSDVVVCPPPPLSPECRRSVFFDYTISASDRTGLRKLLDDKGIEAKIRHPLLLSQHPAYRQFAVRPLPNAERLVKSIISLPIHEKLDDDQIDYVIEVVRAFYRR